MQYYVIAADARQAATATAVVKPADAPPHVPAMGMKLEANNTAAAIAAAGPHSMFRLGGRQLQSVFTISTRQSFVLVVVAPFAVVRTLKTRIYMDVERASSQVHVSGMYQLGVNMAETDLQLAPPADAQDGDDDWTPALIKLNDLQDGTSIDVTITIPPNVIPKASSMHASSIGPMISFGLKSPESEPDEFEFVGPFGCSGVMNFATNSGTYVHEHY